MAFKTEPFLLKNEPESAIRIEQCRTMFKCPREIEVSQGIFRNFEPKAFIESNEKFSLKTRLSGRGTIRRTVRNQDSTLQRRLEVSLENPQ